MLHVIKDYRKESLKSFTIFVTFRHFRDFAEVVRNPDGISQKKGAIFATSFSQKKVGISVISAKMQEKVGKSVISANMQQ